MRGRPKGADVEDVPRAEISVVRGDRKPAREGQADWFCLRLCGRFLLALVIAMEKLAPRPDLVVRFSGTAGLVFGVTAVLLSILPH
jgi:hypothetical protein